MSDFMVALRAIKAKENEEINRIKSLYEGMYFSEAEKLAGRKVRIIKKDQRGDVYYDKIIAVKEISPCHHADFSIIPENDPETYISICGNDIIEIIN